MQKKHKITPTFYADYYPLPCASTLLSVLYADYCPLLARHSVCVRRPRRTFPVPLNWVFRFWSWRHEAWGLRWDDRDPALRPRGLGHRHRHGHRHGHGHGHDPGARLERGAATSILSILDHFSHISHTFLSSTRACDNVHAHRVLIGPVFDVFGVFWGMPDSHLQVPLVTERLPPLLGTDRTFTSTHTGNGCVYGRVSHVQHNFCKGHFKGAFFGGCFVA